MYQALPEGHSTMDKALTRHPVGWGSNPDMTKDFNAPILLGTSPIELSLTHNASRQVLQSEYLS